MKLKVKCIANTEMVHPGNVSMKVWKVEFRTVTEPGRPTTQHASIVYEASAPIIEYRVGADYELHIGDVSNIIQPDFAGANTPPIGA